MLKRVRFTLKGAHKGKDFAPRFAPQFNFVEGVCELPIEEADIQGVAHLLKTYGAVHEIVPDAELDAKQAKHDAKMEANEAAIARAQSFEDDEAEVQKELKAAKQKGARDGGKTTEKSEKKTLSTKDSAANATPKKGDAAAQSSKQEDLI